MPDEVVLVVLVLFIGLPWLVMHYMTKWKQGATLSDDDEMLLEDLHKLARRIEDRLETVERIVAADHPDFRPRRDAGIEPPDAGRDRRLTN